MTHTSARAFNVDASYFVHFAGTHTFKTGYFRSTQSDEVLRTYNGGFVEMYWGQSYQPVTSNTACDGIIASNKANFGQGVCQGRYGYFVIGNGVVNTGADTQSAQAFYFQDSWQVGRGLTLNLGIRLDQENTTSLRSHPLPHGEVRLGRQDGSPPRRRL